MLYPWLIMSTKAVYNTLKAVTPLRRLVRSIKRFVAAYRRTFWVIKGLESGSGQPLTLFFSGQLGNRNYFMRLAMGGNSAEVERASTWRWLLYRRALSPRAGHDIVVIQTADKPLKHESGIQGLYYHGDGRMRRVSIPP